MSENKTETPDFDLESLSDAQIDALSVKFEERKKRIAEENELNEKYSKALKKVSRISKIKEDFLDAAYKDDKELLVDESCLIQEKDNLMAPVMGLASTVTLGISLYLNMDSNSDFIQKAFVGFFFIVGAAMSTVTALATKEEMNGRKETKETLERINQKVTTFKP
jgi:hypothetical protein